MDRDRQMKMEYKKKKNPMGDIDPIQFGSHTHKLPSTELSNVKCNYSITLTEVIVSIKGSAW